MILTQNLKKWPLFFRFKIDIFNIFFKRLSKEVLKTWNSIVTENPSTMSHKMAALNIFCEITQKYFFNGQYSWRRRISSNWNPLKNHEKYFLFHLNKLNILLANQILHILYIFIKPNVWYSWSLKILAIKRCFLFNFAKILQGRHFVVGGPKNFKLLADISFESSLQNTVLPSLLLFLCACY